MIINDDYIFIHVPKTAGNSIEDALGYPRHTRPVKFNGKIVRGHITLRELESVVGKTNTQPRFKFGFVRNTWDRVLSLYCHYTQKAKAARHEYWGSLGFNTWVVKELPHLTTHKNESRTIPKSIYGCSD